jgi:hypothetical protein
MIFLPRDARHGRRRSRTTKSFTVFDVVVFVVVETQWKVECGFVSKSQEKEKR